MHARRRQFDHFSQISRNQIFHAGKPDWSMLKNVDRRVVRHVTKNVPKGERMDDAAKTLGRFIERTNRTTGQSLNRVTNLIKAKSRKRRGRSRAKLNQDARIDGRCSVSSCANKRTQRFAKAVRKFAGNVLDCIVNRGCQGQRAKVQMCLDARCSHRHALNVAIQFRLYLIASYSI